MKHSPVGTVLFLAASIGGCSGGGGGSDNNEPTGTTYASVAKQTLPLLSKALIAKPAMARVAGDPEWMTWGDMADEAAYLFLDPEVWEVNGYSLGVNNIYHLLNQFGTIPASAAATFNSVVTVPWFETYPAGDTAFFPAPFTKDYTDFQNNENYVAKNGNVVDLMRAFPGGATRGSTVYQVRYDGDTNEIQARVQGSWDYTTDYSNAFVMRFEFFGNPSTHQFTLRATKWNSVVEPQGYYLQIVGSGVSQGTGTHFLFKMSDNNMLAHDVLGNTKYFCYNADIGAATDVTATVDTSPCASYRATVDGITGLLYTDMPYQDVFDTTVTTQ